MSLTCYAPFRRSPSACIATDNAAPRLAPVLLLTMLPLDLHVLSLPLAFILSQDQTLLCIISFLFSQLRLIQNNSQKNLRSLIVLVLFACTLVFQYFQIATVISQTGCKDTDFFQLSKFFLVFFKIFFPPLHPETSQFGT